MRKILPKLRFSNYYSHFNWAKYKEVYSNLRVGDILLSVDKTKLAARIIPGEFSHAALCVSQDGVNEVAEMVAEGYREIPFAQFCAEADAVLITRCPQWDEYYVGQVIERVKGLAGVGYDIQFDSTNDTFFCSELVIYGDLEKRLIVDATDDIGWGRPYVSPLGLYMAKNLDKIIDSF